MTRITGYVHKGDFLADDILMILAALVITVGLVLPLWGLAVIMFDFVMIFLPVLLIIGLVAGIIKVMHVFRKTPKTR